MFFHSWNNSNTFPEEEIKVERTKEADKKLESDRGVNNVWWPWKNYDDWLNGRGLKAEPPKKKEKKIEKLDTTISVVYSVFNMTE